MIPKCCQSCIYGTKTKDFEAITFCIIGNKMNKRCKDKVPKGIKKHIRPYQEKRKVIK